MALTAKAIEIKNLQKTYNNGKFQALSDVNLTIEQGDFFGFLGHNGAGKTTTIEILAGITQKDSGNVCINGVNIDENFTLAKSYIGLVPQEFNCNYFETVWDIVIKQAGYHGILPKQAKSYGEYLLEKLDLINKRKVAFRSLSGGMKRRLMIARGLIHQPKILILDEPTAGVDVELRRDMLDFIKSINEKGTTVILTTHYLEEAENLCNNIAILSAGKIKVNTSVSSIVKTLEKETFILDLTDEISQNFTVPGFETVYINSNTIAVTLQKSDTLNTLFQTLIQQNIQVKTLKNKANRIEEFFINLTNK